MTISFACPNCARQLRVKDEAAGHKGKCKDCGTTVRVPAATSQQLTVASPKKPATPAVRSSGEPVQGELIVPEWDPVFPAPSQVGPYGYPQQPAPAPMAYVPPVYASQPAPVVNVVQNVVIGGQAAMRNTLASAALVVAVLACLAGCIPLLGMPVAISLAILTFAMAGLGFLVSLGRRGTGMLTAITAACLGVAAIIISFASSSAALVGGAAAAKNAREAAEAKRTDRVQANPATPARVATPVPLVEHKAPAAVAPKRAPAEPLLAPDEPPPSAAQLKAAREASATKEYGHVLTNARSLIRAKIYPSARTALKRIIDGAPGTKIAAEAQQELDAIANK